MHREGTAVHQLFQENKQVAITSENSQTGEKYLALFNIDDENEQTIEVALSDLGLTGSAEVTEMWTGNSLGETTEIVSATLKPHASALYMVK